MKSMLNFGVFLNLLNEDMHSLYVEIYDQHDREIFYGHGADIPKELRECTVESFSIADASCIHIVLYRCILCAGESVTQEWKNRIIRFTYDHVLSSDEFGGYENSPLTFRDFYYQMAKEISTLIDDFKEDTGITIEWDELESDCKTYVTYAGIFNS